MNAATSRFVEQMGLILEAERFPRIAGRILGLLLTADEPLSLDALAETLEVSKASVSTNARMLAERGVIERTSVAGDRRDLYAAAPDLPLRTLQSRVAKMQRVRDALVDGREAINPRNREVRDRLDDMIESYDIFLEVTGKTLEAMPKRLAQARAARGRTR